MPRNRNCAHRNKPRPEKRAYSTSGVLARKIRDFRNTEGLAMVQIRYLGGFETKNEAFA